METKLDAIKWALSHLDETFYIGSKKHTIVGVGFHRFDGLEWAAICEVENGWSSIDYSDCILSDIPGRGFYGFAYVSINLIENLWKRKKV